MLGFACDREWIGCGWARNKKNGKYRIENFFDFVHYIAENPYLELAEAKHAR